MFHLRLCDPMWAHGTFTRGRRWRTGFPGGASGKAPPANAGDAGSALGLEHSPEKGMDGGQQPCPCLENPMDRELSGLSSMGSQRVGHHWSDLVRAQVEKILPPRQLKHR